MGVKQQIIGQCTMLGNPTVEVTCRLADDSLSPDVSTTFQVKLRNISSGAGVVPLKDVDVGPAIIQNPAGGSPAVPPPSITPATARILTLEPGEEEGVTFVIENPGNTADRAVYAISIKLAESSGFLACTLQDFLVPE